MSVTDKAYLDAMEKKKYYRTALSQIDNLIKKVDTSQHKEIDMREAISGIKQIISKIDFFR